MSFDQDRAWAEDYDLADPLAPFRERFVEPADAPIYLDGNSLGRLPAETVDLLDRTVRLQWGDRLIRSWREGWFDMAQRMGAELAPLIGAKPHEVLVCDSTSANLFKLACAALRARPDRPDVVSDELNFPSDLYVLRSAMESATCGSLHLAASNDGIEVKSESVAALLNERIGLLSLSHTSFKSAFVYPMAEVTALAHAAGTWALWDLSHSVGSWPVDLNGANADLAVGCCYKYLNGGPGAPAFLYVREDLIERLEPPIAGWFGHDAPFEFDLDYRPSGGIERFLIGTPPILSLAAVEPGLRLLKSAGMGRLRQKSIDLTEWMVEFWRRELRPRGFRLRCPMDSERRGSHVAFGHEEAFRITQCLIERFGVIPDFRRPDDLRIGIAPIANTASEVVEAMHRLVEIVDSKSYLEFGEPDDGVT